MALRKSEGVGGWLLVYLVGSIPLMVLCAVGLSGWFFDYPVTLATVIFCILAVPLILILWRSPKAPYWNIAVMWSMAALMTLRAINVFVMPVETEAQVPPRGDEMLAVATTLAGILFLFVAWAVAWTRYFHNSSRVRNMFPLASG